MSIFIMAKTTVIVHNQIIICAGINGLGGHALLASISSICAEGSSNLTVIKDNVTTPDGLAVDWVHGLLFWTDTGRDTVCRKDQFIGG